MDEGPRGHLGTRVRNPGKWLCPPVPVRLPQTACPEPVLPAGLGGVLVLKPQPLSATDVGDAAAKQLSGGFGKPSLSLP